MRAWGCGRNNSKRGTQGYASLESFKGEQQLARNAEVCELEDVEDNNGKRGTQGYANLGSFKRGTVTSTER